MYEFSEQRDVFLIKDECRANLNPYLREVFAKIPHITSGHVLDMGCGSGVSSREIVKTTDYTVTAMDIDEGALSFFTQCVADAGLKQRIDIVYGTFETAIKNGTKFNIVLAEGLFNIIGFETGLYQVCEVLKEGGYLVLHDGKDMIEDKRTLIDSYGFDVCTTLELDEAVWGEKYCGCLERRIAGLNEAELLEEEKAHLKQIKADIALYYDSPQSFQSIYYLLKQQF